MSLEETMKRQLKEREELGILRSLRLNDVNIDFYSNDYLSLSKIGDNTIIESEAPGSSRLIAGNTNLHEHLELIFARFVSQESALLFNSGYTANLGILSTVPKKNDIILFDELSHASIKDGIRLSLAKGIRFKHNDIADLSKKMERHNDSRCFVITEGLFSMNGVYGKLKEIEALCKKHDAHMIVDEAHSGGTYGEEGKGICSSLGIQPFITIFTLGKAFGSHGALVTCSQNCKDYLINFARPFIYTTSLPQALLRRTIDVFEKISLSKQVLLLNNVIQEFNTIFNDYVFTSDLNSPIKIYSPEDKSQLKKIETLCLNEKIGIKAIYPPTVPEGQSCLRISLHADQTKAELNKLHIIFNQV
jgi:8-amino-7-oxononanoate synthase